VDAVGEGTLAVEKGYAQPAGGEEASAVEAGQAGAEDEDVVHGRIVKHFIYQSAES
jgi:hypothetical protein